MGSYLKTRNNTNTMMFKTLPLFALTALFNGAFAAVDSIQIVNSNGQVHATVMNNDDIDFDIDEFLQSYDGLVGDFYDVPAKAIFNSFMSNACRKSFSIAIQQVDGDYYAKVTNQNDKIATIYDTFKVEVR